MPTNFSVTTSLSSAQTAAEDAGYPFMFGLHRLFRTYSTAPSWRELDTGTYLKSTNTSAASSGGLPAHTIFSGAGDAFTESVTLSTSTTYGILLEVPAAISFDSVFLAMDTTDETSDIDFFMKDGIDDDSATYMSYYTPSADTRACLIDFSVGGGDTFTTSATSYMSIQTENTSGTAQLRWGSFFCGQRIQLPRNCLAPGTAALGWRRDLDGGRKNTGVYSRRVKNFGGRKFTLNMPLRESSFSDYLTVAKIENFFKDELNFGTLPFVFVSNEDGSGVNDPIILRLVDPSLDFRETEKGQYMLKWEVEEVPPFIRREHW